MTDILKFLLKTRKIPDFFSRNYEKILEKFLGNFSRNSRETPPGILERETLVLYTRVMN